MKEYQVSYELGSMFHKYVIVAENEAQAISKVINSMYDGSKELMKNFKICLYTPEW